MNQNNHGIGERMSHPHVVDSNIHEDSVTFGSHFSNEKYFSCRIYRISRKSHEEIWREVDNLIIKELKKKPFNKQIT